MRPGPNATSFDAERPSAYSWRRGTPGGRAHTYAHWRRKSELEVLEPADRKRARYGPAREKVKHASREEGAGASDGDPEPPGHIPQLAVFALIGDDTRPRLECHATDVARSRARPNDFGMHRARSLLRRCETLGLVPTPCTPDGPGSAPYRPRDRSLRAAAYQRHAANRAPSRFREANLRMHRARVLAGSRERPDSRVRADPPAVMVEPNDHD